MLPTPHSPAVMGTSARNSPQPHSTPTCQEAGSAPGPSPAPHPCADLRPLSSICARVPSLLATCSPRTEAKMKGFLIPEVQPRASLLEVVGECLL
jgi:hypothetical protein